jgi:hypothetical protein
MQLNREDKERLLKILDFLKSELKDLKEKIAEHPRKIF